MLLFLSGLLHSSNVVCAVFIYTLFYVPKYGLPISSSCNLSCVFKLLSQPIAVTPNVSPSDLNGKNPSSDTITCNNPDHFESNLIFLNGILDVDINFLESR